MRKKLTLLDLSYIGSYATQQSSQGTFFMGFHSDAMAMYGAVNIN